MNRVILAIETSCDETSAAVVQGRKVLSNIISSQVDLHRKWGGIVPEAAARAHVEAVLPVVREALGGASMSLAQIEAIAVTNRPGLVGALSVGLTAAKSLSLALDVPIVGVHHIEGHILSPFAILGDFDSPPPFPHACLVVSGGHTELVEVTGDLAYRILGRTIDDSAGEAFDKAARLLGLGYPGGFAIQEMAKGGSPKYSLPRGLSEDSRDYSFSGFKTAVMRLVQKEGSNLNISDAAASVQETIASVLSDRALRAVEEGDYKAMTIAGGVAANLRLRELLTEGARRRGIDFIAPPLELCTDNAAMIGVAGAFRLARGECDDLSLDCLPMAPLPGSV